MHDKRVMKVVHMPCASYKDAYNERTNLTDSFGGSNMTVSR